MNAKLQELRETIKRQANDLREMRRETKELQRAGKYAGRLQSEMVELKYLNRHHHIAYAELIGRTREEIERPRADNLPIECLIDSLKEAYTPTASVETTDEVVCNHAT